MKTPEENKLHLLQTVLESMHEGFMAWSTDYTLVAWNQLFLDYWHYPAELMRVGLPLIELLEYQVSLGTYSDQKGSNREVAEKHFAMVLDEFKQSVSGNGYERITKSTSGHWLRMRRRLVDGFGFVTWASDVTEQYVADQAAELLHDNINSFSDSIIMTDVEGRVVFTNHRYHEIYPASPSKDEIIGYTLEELIRMTLASGNVGHPLAKTDPEAWVQDRLAERRQLGASTLETRHNNGRYYQIKLMRDEKTGSIIVTSDITDQVRSEEALQEAKDNLEARVEGRTSELREEMRQREIASRAKSEFLANMSHELRTPLNAVIGFSETMLKEVRGPLGNPSYKEYAKAINDAGEHLLELVNDVLDLAKVESGTRSLYEEEVDLAELIAWAMRMITEQAAAKGLELATFALSYLAPDRVYADERALRQILLNLLSNAVKFTNASGKVEVLVGIDEKGGVVISVVDNGIGIAAENLDRVMEQFSQALAVETRDHEGSGLGLPLAKKLVELHGGKFSLSSELGVGTTVSFSLPPERNISR